MKKQSGITLVALIITIIVLLILAGVSISLLTGQDNVVTKAGEAANAYNAAVQDEYDRLQPLINTLND